MNKILLVIGILLFIIFVFNSNKPRQFPIKNKTIEKFTYFKKNNDLKQALKQKNIDMKITDNIKTRQLPPVKNDIPITKKFVEAKDLVESARVPDNFSDDDNYNIPLPQFDDKNDDYIFKNLKPFPSGFEKTKQNVINAENDDGKDGDNGTNKKYYDKVDSLNNELVDLVNKHKNSSDKKKGKKNKKNKNGKNGKNGTNGTNGKITGKNIRDKCRFFTSTSYDHANFKCPKSHPVKAGASFESKNLSCEGDTIKIEKPVAIAWLKDGQVAKIQMLKRGSHYVNPPKIRIIGDGTNASAYCTIKNGRIHKVIIQNGGENYTSTPKVRIENPELQIKCNLCCNL